MPFQIPHSKTVSFIEEIRGTNNSPLLFLCSSENDTDPYFLKCVRRDIEHPCLVFEFICSALARQLGLHTPDTALVSVQENSYEQRQLSSYQNTIRPGITVFASKLVPNVVEASKLELVSTKPTFETFARPLDLVRISLFDLIVENRDRNRNNLNLLVSQEKKKELIVIDHYNTFGGPGNAGKTLSASAPFVDATLLGTGFCRSILHYVDREKLINEIDTFANAYASVNVEKNVDDVLNQMPDEWPTPRNLRSQLKQFLCNNARIKEITDKTKKFILSNYH